MYHTGGGEPAHLPPVPETWWEESSLPHEATMLMETDRQTDRQTDRLAGRFTIDRQADGQTCIHHQLSLQQNLILGDKSKNKQKHNTEIKRVPPKLCCNIQAPFQILACTCKSDPSLCSQLLHFSELCLFGENWLIWADAQCPVNIKINQQVLRCLTTTFQLWTRSWPIEHTELHIIASTMFWHQQRKFFNILHFLYIFETNTLVQCKISIFFQEYRKKTDCTGVFWVLSRSLTHILTGSNKDIPVQPQTLQTFHKGFHGTRLTLSYSPECMQRMPRPLWV